MAQYKADQMTFGDLYNKIQANSIQYPKFQRNIVWGEKKIKNLIETIQKGYPFGSILLYRPADNGVGNYKLIDGLQRYTAISKYKIAPLQYYPNFNEKYEILETEINNLIKDKLGTSDEQLKQLSDQLKQKFKGYSKKTRLSEIISDYKGILVYSDILEIVENFIEEIDKEIEIDNISIPVIYFDGNENELAEVFQRINEGGKPLTKYEIFASSWGGYIKNNFQDKEIIDVLVKSEILSRW